MRTHRILLGLPALLAAASLALPASGQGLDAEAKEVVKRAAAAYGGQCDWEDENYFLDNPPERWTLSWMPAYGDAEQSLTLYKLFCFMGAYNVSHIYYTASEEPFSGIQPVAFAMPEFEVIYENDDFEGAVEDIVVEGMTTAMMLVNSEFDPETQTIADFSLWRGIGDASSGGVWQFKEGRFVLKTYDVDASYDGESNPTTLTDYE